MLLWPLSSAAVAVDGCWVGGGGGGGDMEANVASLSKGRGQDTLVNSSV